MSDSTKRYFIDRHQGGERAILVHIDFYSDAQSDELLEFKDLATAAGAVILEVVTGQRQQPSAKYFIGQGKAEQVREAVQAYQADVVLFNHALTPAQERNCEQLFQCRVLDRNGLILDIFAQRARTYEGKLQVELAQLQHLSTRLVRGWTHLERQKGGIGLRGPGETQLETDRRLLAVRIKNINKRLARVLTQREQSRRGRKRAAIPTVSVVGYTNAGKSTLFNALTSADSYAANQLFATLDPTLRQLELPHQRQVILADTVGFIRHLPHDLVAAFRATLEETCQADLLLHVVDAHHAQSQQLMADVNQVLQEIGADQVKQLLIYNKIDLEPGTSPHIDYDYDHKPCRVWCSALTGSGLDLIAEAISQLLSDDWVEYRWSLAADEGGLRAALYEYGEVIDEQQDQSGESVLKVRLPTHTYYRLLKRYRS